MHGTWSWAVGSKLVGSARDAWLATRLILAGKLAERNELQGKPPVSITGSLNSV